MFTPQIRKTERSFLRGFLTAVTMTAALSLGAGLALAEDAGKVQSLSAGKEITLKGHVTKEISGDKYLFEDSTGTTTVIISKAEWKAVHPTPTEMVEISGKVEKVGSETMVKAKHFSKVK